MTPRRHLVVALVALLALGWANPLRGQQLIVTPDHADGLYDVGQTVRWRVQWTGNAAATAPTTAPVAATAPTTAPAAPIHYVVKKDGLTETGTGALTLDDDGAATVEARFDEPGTFLLVVTAKTADGKERKAVGGAVAAPERIGPSAERPDDFDAFWDEKIKELADVPLEPRLEPADADRAGVRYEKITLDHIKGSKIRGQVARPETGEKFPALLIVQWAGVYPLQKSWVTDRAAEGWLALNILAHDLPIDRPEPFYKEMSAGPLKDYPAIGNDDREKSYFLRMYLASYRAADYLAHHPNWDGKTLVVMGASQGGQQALVTAALHPKVTAALASVPAGCDMLGPAAGRAPGWPMWYWQVKDGDPDKVRQTSRYFDVVNFAPRITAPMLVGIGLIDQTCPPAGILAATNLVRGPKEVILLPRGAHHNENGSHAPYDRRLGHVWLPALKQGKPAPVQP